MDDNLEEVMGMNGWNAGCTPRRGDGDGVMEALRMDDYVFSRL